MEYRVLCLLNGQKKLNEAFDHYLFRAEVSSFVFGYKKQADLMS